MARHRTVVDVEARRVHDRAGEWHALDRVETAESGLYYARPFQFAMADYHERWLLPEQGWSVGRFRFVPGAPETFDWYIEMDLIRVNGLLWTVLDGYVDMIVWEGKRSRLDDADELGDGMADGSISVEEAATVLRSLDRLCDELHANGNSGAALLERYASGLPR